MEVVNMGFNIGGNIWNNVVQYTTQQNIKKGQFVDIFTQNSYTHTHARIYIYITQFF